MKRIITLTLSPTIDKSTTVDRVVAEQKLQCAEPIFEPGGGGINVSRGLMRLGQPSVAVFPAGGLTGKHLVELLAEENIEQAAILTKYPTRENFIVVNRTTNEQFRFGMPAPELLQKEEQEILKQIKQLLSAAQFMVVSGSVPKGVSCDFLAKIAHLARKQKVNLAVDTSGDALKCAVDEGVYLLKPNQNELGKLAGTDVNDNESVEEAANKIISEGKCEIVVVSMGPHGAYLVSKEYSEHIQAPSVKKRSTVGAGDSMVAGMVYGYCQGYDVRNMVRMGIACGTAATMNPGTELFKKADAERLYKWLLTRKK